MSEAVICNRSTVDLSAEAITRNTPSRVVIVGGGVAGISATRALRRANKTLAMPADRAGRIRVDARLNIPDDTHVYVIGDAPAVIADGANYRLSRRSPFGTSGGGLRAISRVDPSLVTFAITTRAPWLWLGRTTPLLETRHLRLGGFQSWGVWALIDLMFLPQPQIRLRVQTQWLWSYLTNQRGSRLIPESSLSGGGDGGKAP